MRGGVSGGSGDLASRRELLEACVALERELADAERSERNGARGERPQESGP
jgi:hypothetical protein